MKKILLIEDDEILRESTDEFLQEEGFSVSTANNGLEGIQKALDEFPDIILCDIAMPKFNGYQVYKTLQENSSTSLIPFIFLTAKTEKEDVRRGMQLGADDYITKPFDYDELLTTINVRLEKREKMIEAHRETYSSLLENSISGVFILDDNLKFLYSNPKFQNIFGYAPSETKNISLLQVVHPSYRDPVEEKIRKILKGIQAQFSMDLEGLHMNQNIVPLKFFAGRAHFHGQTGIIGQFIETNTAQPPPVELQGFPEEELENAVKYILEKKNMIPRDAGNQIVKAFSKKPSNGRKTELVNKLTRREKEILNYICQGYTNQEIANKLFISQRTVDGHRASVLSKTYTRNTAELVMFAVKNGLVEV